DAVLEAREGQEGPAAGENAAENGALESPGEAGQEPARAYGADAEADTGDGKISADEQTEDMERGAAY
ncbi:MAG: hypothetical protein AB1609_23535, partial [Bacillota bacterium]